MLKATLTLNFFLDKERLFTGNACIPRGQIQKIPQLAALISAASKKQTNGNVMEVQVDRSVSVRPKSYQKSSEPDPDEEEEFDNENENENENEDDNENGDENEVEMGMDEEIEPPVNNYVDDIDMEPEDVSSDQEEASMSYSLSLSNLNKFKTKRQRGIYNEFVELPEKRTRKAKNEGEDIVRRQEKEQKRKQYLKKQMEAQEKATLDKILNEAGRKLRLRQQKDAKDEIRRENRKLSNLGNVPKTVYKSCQGKNFIQLHRSLLFDPKVQTYPEIKMKELCTSCGSGVGKYKMKNNNFACSLDCYKRIVGTF